MSTQKEAFTTSRDHGMCNIYTRQICPSSRSPVCSGQIAKLLWRNPMRKEMTLWFYKGGKCSTEQLNELAQVAELGRSRVLTWVFPLAKPLHLTLGSTTFLAMPFIWRPLPNFQNHFAGLMYFSCYWCLRGK